MLTRLKPGSNIEAMIEKPLQRTKGVLLFIESVEGENFAPLKNLKLLLEEAIRPPNNFETLNWLKIGYEFFY